MNLSVQEQAVLKTIAANYKLTPATLLHKISKGTWIPSKHLLYISKVIAKAIAQGNGRIVISAPPRHGKSQLIDVGVPIWVMENFPTYQTILASYGADLSEDFGREVRDTIIANEDLLTVRIPRATSKVNNFETESKGGMVSVGLGGAITGRGGNVLLLDDYIKEIKEALSPAHRNYVWNWFTSTFYTRLEPGGTVIIIATRWHSDDLIGRIKKHFPGKWTFIELPAEITDEAQAQKDPIGRKVGDVLFTERYPIEKLQEIRTLLGSTFYEALYQQRPVDETNKLTDGDWLKIEKNPPSIASMRRARVWDLAATEGGGDYTVGTLCAWDPLNVKFYIYNVMRRQLSPKQAEALVRQTAITDGVDTEVLIEQEPGSAGKALYEHYNTTILPEFKVFSTPTTNAKVVRAQPFIAGAEAGLVYLVEGAWNTTFIQEFDEFPGQFDDQVDTASAGYTKLTGRKIFSATWGRAAPQDKKTTRAIRGAILNISNRNRVAWGRNHG